MAPQSPLPFCEKQNVYYVPLSFSFQVDFGCKGYNSQVYAVLKPFSIFPRITIRKNKNILDIEFRVRKNIFAP